MECRYGKGPNGRGRWREKKNNKGWQYLALALTGTPFTIAVRKANKGNVFKTISALKNKYEATEVGEYGELTREFIGATMKSNKEDPEAYIGSFLKFQSHKYMSAQTTPEIFLVTKQSVHTLAKDRRHGIFVVITKRTLPKFFSQCSFPPQNIKNINTRMRFAYMALLFLDFEETFYHRLSMYQKRLRDKRIPCCTLSFLMTLLGSTCS